MKEQDILLADSHCHLHMLDLTESQSTVDDIVAAAHENGVQHMLCVGTTIEDLPEILGFSKRYPNIFASVGLHPNEETELEPTVDKLVDLANSDPHIKAIGETGLDYYRSTGDLTWQQNRFRKHIQAAIACKKPLIIHTRAARVDTLNILKEEQAHKVGGVFHCFTEDWDTAQAALDLGFYVSFSGIVTFKNALELQEVAKKLPLEHMLIETDAPYLAPIPYRGKMNQPAYVRHVAEFIAQLKEVTLEEVARTTTANYQKLFLMCEGVKT